MTDPHLPAKLYGEQEIGRILKRATELQHREPTAPAAGGITLAELEEIAAEAGIDPRYLRRAAMEVDTGTRDPSFWADVVGEDLTLVREVTLPGELSDDGFERIVAAIQTHSRVHGQPSLLGRTLTWRAESPSKTRTVQIVVTSRDGRTQIRFEENLSQAAAGLFAGVTSGVGAGVGIGAGVPLAINVFGSALLAVATPIGVTALSFLACRAIYRGMVRRRRRSLDQLMTRVIAEAETSIGSSTPQAGDSENALPSSV